MSDFDVILWRDIRDGNEFDYLMPKETCKSTLLGEGFTDYSIDMMEQVVNQYEYQTKALAKVLQKTSVADTALNIHDFLYEHFQYKADNADQMLRSPACSWYDRKKGIDCKSYSIFASCLLLNMNITHYIRKIKQPSYAPEDFSHVYVVVPKNQNTGNLSQGYYVIDGTLEMNIEPTFVEKSDLKMAGLKHYSLNGATQSTFAKPANNTKTIFGLSSGVADEPSFEDQNGGQSSSSSDTENSFYEKVLGFLPDIGLKDLSLNNIETLFKQIDCIGGSAYDRKGFDLHIANTEKYFKELVLKINTAVANKKYEEFSTLIIEFFGNSQLFVDATIAVRNQGWNSCTTKLINGNIEAFTFYRDVVGKLLRAWLNEYFDLYKQPVTQSTSVSQYPAIGTFTAQQTAQFLLQMNANIYSPEVQASIGNFGQTSFSNVGIEEKYGFRFIDGGTNIKSYMEINKYIPAPDLTTPIPPFTLTPYALDQIKIGKPVDLNTFLDSIETAAQIFLPVQTPTLPNGEGSYYDSNGQIVGQNADNVKKAGFGIAGWLLLVAGAGIVFSKMKDKPLQKSSAKKTTQTTKK